MLALLFIHHVIIPVIPPLLHCFVSFYFYRPPSSSIILPIPAILFEDLCTHVRSSGPAFCFQTGEPSSGSYEDAPRPVVQTSLLIAKDTPYLPISVLAEDLLARRLVEIHRRQIACHALEE